MRYFGKLRSSLIASRKSRVKGAVCPLLLTALSLFFPALVSAQDEGERPELGRSRAAQYYLGDQDELLIKVNIWGFVRRPGQYMVPKDTDLISLISFAGGPLEQARMKKIKIIRSSIPAATSNGATIGANAGEMMLASPAARGGAAFKAPSTSAQQVIEVNVKKYLETGQPSLIPELQPGDTIVIAGGALQFVGKALDFVSRFAVIAQIYFWVDVANNR